METANALQENIDQLVSFTMDKEEFSFPINAVQEIVRLPEVTAVPGAPESVKGIMNLRGSILPLIDLRIRLGLDTAEYSDETRVVVIRHQGAATGMIVDRVNEVLHVEGNELEPPPAAVESSRANWLRGLARIDDGRRVMMILSEGRIIPNAADNVKEIFGQNTSASGQEQDMALEDEKHLVSFRLGNEEFAVNITEVREIVRVEDIIQMPQAPDFVLGVMALRNALLPVIDLRTRFGMRSAAGKVEKELSDDEIDARRIIVADLGGVTTGLMVDAVSEGLRLPEKDVAPTPEVIDADNARYIQGVGKLKNGSRLLMLLDLPGLLSGEEKETVAVAAGKQQEKGGNSVGLEKDLEDERQLVCFRIADEEYGIDIMQVQEIIRIDAITAVPGAPSYVSGIVNLRGNVLPVIDLRRRFGRESCRQSEQSRILVVEMEGKTTGLIVDAVSEVLRVPESSIEPTPPLLSASASGRYITGIGKLEDGNRAIILVNTDAILNQEEIEALPGADGMENVPGGTPVSVDGELSQRTESGEENNARPDAGDASDAAQVAVDAEESGVTDAGTESPAEDIGELITGAVESAEEKKKADARVGDGKEIEEMMALTKAELLSKAEKLGLRVDTKMPKKQIAALIVEKA